MMTAIKEMIKLFASKRQPSRGVCTVMREHSIYETWPTSRFFYMMFQSDPNMYIFFFVVVSAGVQRFICMYHPAIDINLISSIVSYDSGGRVGVVESSCR